MISIADGWSAVRGIVIGANAAMFAFGASSIRLGYVLVAVVALLIELAAQHQDNTQNAGAEGDRNER